MEAPLAVENGNDWVLTRPMISTKVVVAVREYGYKSKMTQANFRTHCVEGESEVFERWREVG